MGPVFPPLSFALWGISTAWYFCNPPSKRMRRQQQRAPACCALCTTCALFLLMGLLSVTLHILSSLDDGDYGHGQHRGLELLNKPEALVPHSDVMEDTVARHMVAGDL